MIWDILFPHEYAPGVFSIDYEELYRLGYRAILFDIDNTLVHHGYDSNEEVDALFRRIHKIGLKTLLLSNNGQERISRFCANIDTPFISNADKPNPRNYRKAVQMLGVGREETVVIGDQIFTDILGANLSGMPSILVRYLRKPGEVKIGKRRTAELYVLKLYSRCKSRQNRIGNIIVTGEKL